MTLEGGALPKTAEDRILDYRAFETETERRESNAEVLSLSVSRVLTDHEERLEKGVERIRTGYSRLDAALGGGIEVPSLTVLGAPPKAVKSTFTMKVAETWIAQGGAVYYLDLENGPRRFLRRLLCRKAGLGMSTVAAALKSSPFLVFESRDEVIRWKAAKEYLHGSLAGSLFCEFTPPTDYAARLASVKEAVGDRKILAVVDSLQKLPMDFDDRRGSVDKWVRLFEQLRYDLGVTFWVVSEVKRGRDGYAAREDAFKESGGIEYGADLALTLNRPSADQDTEAPATLRVELARDCDEDPRGEIASYRPIFPCYDLEEVEPVPVQQSKRRGPVPEKREAAREFLADLLAGGPLAKGEVLTRVRDAGFGRTLVYRVAKELGLADCTVGLKSGWRLP